MIAMLVEDPAIDPHLVLAMLLVEDAAIDPHLVPAMLVLEDAGLEIDAAMMLAALATAPAVVEHTGSATLAAAP